MKFYNSDKLFIGSVGYTYKENKQIGINADEIAITKQDPWYPSCYYFDIISNKKYIDFHDFSCIEGKKAIIKPENLYLFIHKHRYVFSEIKQLEKIVNKILIGKKISDKDVKALVIFLNSYYKQKNNQKNDSCDTNSNTTTNTNDKNIYLDMTYSTILTDKIFKNNPAIGRDNEVNEVIITLAQDKKNPILVGPSGTGKTTIVDQLAYKIQKNDVPNFLKNKKIIELNLSSLLSGTKYVGTLEEKFVKIINFVIEKDAIIFIDEIHTIYGAGAHSKSDYDIASMIKQAIDRQGLKVIGTTTIEEYEKYFSNDALKRRFEKVLVNEPTDDILFQIINKVFNDYSKNNNIKLLTNMDNIISTLIKLTNTKHRTWDDNICNPDLVIGIIDRIFADAKVNNQYELTIHNIIYGINSCNRVYNSSKEKAISNLDIKEENQTVKSKIIQFKKKN